MDHMQQLRKDIQNSIQNLEGTHHTIKRLCEDLVNEVRLTTTKYLFDDPNSPKYYETLLDSQRQILKLQRRFDLVRDCLESKDGGQDSRIPQNGPLTRKLPICSSPSVPLNIPTPSELTHFKSVSDFWVEPGGNEQQALTLLLENFNLNPTGELRPQDLKKGSFCMATLPSEEVWHRARILDLGQEGDGGAATVQYVDYGKTAARPLSQLLALPPDLADFPSQVVHCCLKDAPKMYGEENKAELARINKLLEHCMGIPGIFVTFYHHSSPEDIYPVEVALKLQMDGLSLDYDFSFGNLQIIVQDVTMEPIISTYLKRMESLLRSVNKESEKKGLFKASSFSSLSVTSSHLMLATDTRRNSTASACPDSNLNSLLMPRDAIPDTIITPRHSSTTEYNSGQFPSSSTSSQTNNLMAAPSVARTRGDQSSGNSNSGYSAFNNCLSENTDRKLEDLISSQREAPTAVPLKTDDEETSSAEEVMEKSPDIPEAIFPTKRVGEKFLLSLTAVGKEPGEVYISLPTDETMEEEERIQHVLNGSQWGDEIFDNSPVRNGSCWAIRRREEWHRVRVVSLGKTAEDLEVQHVDKGFQGKARRQELKPLPLELMGIRCHAHLCLLNGFTPQLAENPDVLKYLYQSTSGLNLYTGILLSQLPGSLPVLDLVVSVIESDGPTLVDLLKTKVKLQHLAAASDPSRRQEKTDSHSFPRKISKTPTQPPTSPQSTSTFKRPEVGSRPGHSANNLDKLLRCATTANNARTVTSDHLPSSPNITRPPSCATDSIRTVTSDHLPSSLNMTVGPGPRRRQEKSGNHPNPRKISKTPTQPPRGTRPVIRPATPAVGLRPGHTANNNLDMPPSSLATDSKTSDHPPSSPHITNHLGTWDPMQEDFNKPTNSYVLSTDDPELAVAGYKSKEEQYVCKFFAYEGRCRRERCPYEHIPLKRYDLPTHDKDVTNGLNQDSMPFPEEGSILYTMVSAVSSPKNFFLVFPYGTQVELSGYNLGSQSNTSANNLQELMAQMKKFYANVKPSTVPGVLPAISSLMVCRDSSGTWYRCKILEAGPEKAKVNLIDFGSNEIFPLSCLRDIDRDFIFMAPQCLECQLAGVIPIEETWSSAAIKRFDQLVTSKLITATFTDCSALPLTVSLSSLETSISVGNRLLKEGLARPSPLLPTAGHPIHNGLLPG